MGLAEDGSLWKPTWAEPGSEGEGRRTQPGSGFGSEPAEEPSPKFSVKTQVLQVLEGGLVGNGRSMRDGKNTPFSDLEESLTFNDLVCSFLHLCHSPGAADSQTWRDLVCLDHFPQDISAYRAWLRRVWAPPKQ